MSPPPTQESEKLSCDSLVHMHDTKPPFATDEEVVFVFEYECPEDHSLGSSTQTFFEQEVLENFYAHLSIMSETYEMDRSFPRQLRAAIDKDESYKTRARYLTAISTKTPTKQSIPDGRYTIDTELAVPEVKSRFREFMSSILRKHHSSTRAWKYPGDSASEEGDELGGEEEEEQAGKQGGEEDAKGEEDEKSDQDQT